MTLPSGTLAHSLGHNTLGKADIAVQTLFLGICLIAVALRLWSRRLQWLSLQINDCLILSSTVSLAICLLSVENGNSPIQCCYFGLFTIFADDVRV